MTINATVAGLIPTRGNALLSIDIFHIFALVTRPSVEFRNSTRNNSKIWRKMGTECLRSRFPMPHYPAICEKTYIYVYYIYMYIWIYVDMVRNEGREQTWVINHPYYWQAGNYVNSLYYHIINTKRIGNYQLVQNTIRLYGFLPFWMFCLCWSFFFNISYIFKPKEIINICVEQIT